MMRKNVQVHARVYAQILAGLFTHQNLSGTLQKATRGARHLSLGIRLNNPNQVDKAIKLSEPLALAAKVETVLSQRQTGLIVYQFQLQETFWQYYTRQDVTASEIGLAEQRQPVSFTFEDAPHALFGGTSGSGKTEAIKSALLALMEVYRPSELALILIDTDNVLDDFRNCAHLLIPIANDFNEADNALLFANQILAHRKANNVKDDKRIVIVIDEVSDLTGKESNVELLRQLAKQGRKYRVNLVIGNQKPSQKELPSILDNLLNKFIGQVDNAHTSAMLTGHSGLEAHKLTGQGDFLHIAHSQVSRFQVAMAQQADFDRLERTEVQPIEIESSQPIELPESNRGRPKTQIEAKPLAFYIVRGVENVSIAQAEKWLQFPKSKHNFYKQFIADFTAEFHRLRKAGIR